MYYEESLRLTEQSPIDKAALRFLDREIAHAYSPSGTGFTQLSLLRRDPAFTRPQIENLMGLYESSGVVARYEQVTCQDCDAENDPGEDECLNCGSLLSGAIPNGEICYRILKQPTQPVYDPAMQPAQPVVFISYRHADSSVLAADIYYALRAEGYSVFLDNGNIPVGADAERVFLQAASSAGYFIALVSSNYFQSEYCKREIAHAARCRRRLIRVNIPPIPAAPNDMPWIDGPNWNRYPGSNNGLDLALEQSLLSAVRIPATSGTIADLRNESCQFLMEQLSLSDLDRLWNRLPYMRDVEPRETKPRKIMQILQETTSQRLELLCNALAP